MPRLRGQVVNCGWCGKFVAVPLRGRVPKWCSPACRHRAWEQRRAAASGLAAIEVVEQVVERPVRVEVRVPAPPRAGPAGGGGGRRGGARAARGPPPPPPPAPPPPPPRERERGREG